jgi:urease accessory protein
MDSERGALGIFPARHGARGLGASWAVLAAGATSLLCGPAAAHVGTALPGGFVSGFMHPLSGVDHLLAMVSVGLWGAFLGRPLIYAVPVVFPAMMVGGAIMGMFVLPLPPVELGIALSVLVLGGCIALSVRAPVWAASLVVALFAVFHGYAHGKELPSAADPVSYSAGFVLATGLLHVSGIGVGFLNERPGGVVATRSAGGVIAAVGNWFLYQAIHT